jgi:hypothetical protein
MKLHEMTDREREALGALVRLMVGADGATSPEESSDLQKVAAELGESEFWTLVRTAPAEPYTRDAVQSQARNVERKDVQQRIYGVLFTIAAEGAIMGREGELLAWLGEVWGIEAGGASAPQS